MVRPPHPDSMFFFVVLIPNLHADARAEQGVSICDTFSMGFNCSPKDIWGFTKSLYWRYDWNKWTWQPQRRMSPLVSSDVRTKGTALGGWTVVGLPNKRKPNRRNPTRNHVRRQGKRAILAVNQKCAPSDDRGVVSCGESEAGLQSHLVFGDGTWCKEDFGVAFLMHLTVCCMPENALRTNAESTLFFQDSFWLFFYCFSWK